MIGYDGFKHRRGTKVHVAVDEEAKLLALTLSPGNTLIQRSSRNYTIGLTLSL